MRRRVLTRHEPFPGARYVAARVNTVRGYLVLDSRTSRTVSVFPTLTGAIEAASQLSRNELFAGRSGAGRSRVPSSSLREAVGQLAVRLRSWLGGPAATPRQAPSSMPALPAPPPSVSGNPIDHGEHRAVTGRTQAATMAPAQPVRRPRRLRPELYEGLTSSIPDWRREASEQLLRAVLPDGWSHSLESSGASWIARATALDGRQVVVRHPLVNGALRGLARRLAHPERHAKPPPPPETRPRVRPRRTPRWRYPRDADAFLDYVAPLAPDDAVRQADVLRFLARTPEALASMPPDLISELKRRRLWPGQYWPTNDERRMIERIEGDGL